MRTLPAAALLDAWESGLHVSALQRALILLGAACPDAPREVLALLPIGQRDRRLLTLREQIFGARLASLATCPQCGEELELACDVGEIRIPYPDEHTEIQARVGEYTVEMRLPNSLDLAALAAHDRVAAPGQFLFLRCLLEARQAGEPCSAAELPATVVEAVIEQLGQVDPQADIRIAMSCPACGHSWQAPFDIVSFFWCELDAWARRTLREIHHLARAYGWREAEILALSPRRRQLYLQQIGP